MGGMGGMGIMSDMGGMGSMGGIYRVGVPIMAKDRAGARAKVGARLRATASPPASPRPCCESTLPEHTHTHG